MSRNCAELTAWGSKVDKQAENLFWKLKNEQNALSLSKPGTRNCYTKTGY